MCVAVLSLGRASAQGSPRVAPSPVEVDVLARAPSSTLAGGPLSSILDVVRAARPSPVVMRRDRSGGVAVVEAVVFTLASKRPADEEADLGSLDDFLPDQLGRDLLRLRSQVQDAREVLFGRRGIVRLGSPESSGGASRLRMNLQWSPDPGIRFTLVTH